jgi:Zn-dependent peptidase ImmA (M78 family)
MNIPIEWQNYCKSKADEILREFSEHNTLTIPVPIQEIIESYVGDVNFVTHEDLDFPEGVSAFAQKDILLGWLVVVNGKECVERQRFSSAHELGHMALIQNQSSRVFCSTDKGSWQEKLCDRFAGYLLMPEGFVRDFYRKHPSPRLEEVAKAFKVSLPVAEIQLNLLKLPFNRSFQQ